MTEPSPELVSACESLCNTFFGLAASPDDPAAIATADDALRVLDQILVGAA